MNQAALTNGLHKWTQSITGPVRDIANISAVGIIAFMLVRSQDASEARSREDRTMFREELKTMHVDSQRKWEAINSSQRTVAGFAEAFRAESASQQKAAIELVAALRALASETQKLKDETKKNTDKPPG